MTTDTPMSAAIPTRNAGPTHKTLYIVWGENIGSGGIFDNQVAELLLALQRRQRDVSLLVGLPVPTLLKAGLRTRSQGASHAFDAAQRKLERLRAAGIVVHVRWLPLALNYYARFWQLPFYHLGHVRFLRELARRERIATFHCRSYHAAVLATLANRSLGLKVIFDPRGLFPEEGALYHRFRAGGVSFHAWKRVERRLLDACDVSVAISTPFGAHLRAISADARIEVIPAGARIEQFEPRARPGPWPSLTNANTAAPIVLAFLGTFDASRSFYYSLKALADVRASLQRAWGPTRFLIITASAHAPLEHALRSFGVLPDDFELTSSSNLAQTAALLRRADFAIYPFDPQLAHRQDPILATILGSKTGEYLAAGLPVITTAAVGAISSLVRNRKLGVCLSSTNLAELNASDVAELRALWNEYDDTQRRCLAAASDFSIERTAARYAALYASLDQPAQAIAPIAPVAQVAPEPPPQFCE
jgi:glycosyltransferase involved in cell wall biosynthesis